MMLRPLLQKIPKFSCNQLLESWEKRLIGASQLLYRQSSSVFRTKLCISKKLIIFKQCNYDEFEYVQMNNHRCSWSAMEPVSYLLMDKDAGIQLSGSPQNMIKTDGPPAIFHSIFSSCEIESMSQLESHVAQVESMNKKQPVKEQNKFMMETDQPNKRKHFSSSKETKVKKSKSVLSEGLLSKVTRFVKENPEVVQEQSGSLSVVSNVADDLKSDHDVRDTELDNILSGDCELDLAHLNAKKGKNLKKRKRNQKAKDGDKMGKVDGKEKRKFPNYFVAIPITNPQIHQSLKMVQDHIIDQQPELKQALIPLHTLHFTVMVMYLEEEDISRACKVLEDCKEKLEEIISEPIILSISGIANFRNSVVFATIEAGEAKERLSKLADIVSQCMINHNLASTDSRDFQPHLTIMKLSKAPKLKYKGIRKIDRSLYEEVTSTQFGLQTVLGLQLCAMLKRKDHLGYYHTECMVKLVDDDYKEPDMLKVNINKVDNEELRMSHEIVSKAILSAIHTLRQQHLQDCRNRKISAINQTKAKQVVSRALKDFSSRKSQTFTVELEKEIAWKFEKGELLSKEDLLNLLKGAS